MTKLGRFVELVIQIETGSTLLPVPTQPPLKENSKSRYISRYWVLLQDFELGIILSLGVLA